MNELFVSGDKFSYSVLGHHTAEKAENIREARKHFTTSDQRRQGAAERAAVAPKSPAERLAELNAGGLGAKKERARIARLMEKK